MLCQLGLEVCFEAFAIGLCEGNRSRNVEVVEEVGDMEKHRVTSLVYREGSGELRSRTEVFLTSVTPNNLIVVLPPCSVPSSASIC